MRSALLAALFLSLTCRAQDFTHFDVASLRTSPQPEGLGGRVLAPMMQGGPGSADPGQITYRDVTLHNLINIAYGVRSDQVIGDLSPQHLDIIAKIPAGATKEQFNMMPRIY